MSKWKWLSPVNLHGEQHELLTGRSCFVELMRVFFTLNRSFYSSTPVMVGIRGNREGGG